MAIICKMCGKKQGGWIQDFPIKDSNIEGRICANCNSHLEEIRRVDNEKWYLNERKYFEDIIENTDEEIREYLKLIINEKDKMFQEINARKKEAQDAIEAEQKAEEELRNKCKQALKEIIVTTGEIHQDYDIIGPVYIQLSNKGILSSSYDSLLAEYIKDIKEMQKQGVMSRNRLDWGFLYGEWSVGQSDFEKAFYVATEELKKRAFMLGGDAVVFMKQDIDIDTNGFSYFYLQMYGTAVKLRK